VAYRDSFEGLPSITVICALLYKAFKSFRESIGTRAFILVLFYFGHEPLNVVVRPLLVGEVNHAVVWLASAECYCQSINQSIKNFLSWPK